MNEPSAGQLSWFSPRWDLQPAGARQPNGLAWTRRRSRRTGTSPKPPDGRQVLAHDVVSAATLAPRETVRRVRAEAPLHAPFPTIQAAGVGAE